MYASACDRGVVQGGQDEALMNHLNQAEILPDAHSAAMWRLRVRRGKYDFVPSWMKIADGDGVGTERIVAPLENALPRVGGFNELIDSR